MKSWYKISVLLALCVIPWIALFGVTPLVVLTPSLPSGTAGFSYTAGVVASGGTPPYTWSVTPGYALPAGITLTNTGGPVYLGQLSGVSATSGLFFFSLRVTDVFSTSRDQTFTLPISPPATLPYPNPVLATVDTSYKCHIGGTTYTPTNAAQLTTDLGLVVAGDTIVLTAGALYSGNFVLPVLSNPSQKWTCIISSGLASLPVGVRVSPASTVHMATVTTATTTPPITLASGASYWRLAGLEVRSDSIIGGNPGGNPPQNPWSSYAIQTHDGTNPAANHVIEDRLYVHGSNTQDIITAVDITGANMAVIDSYISDIHGYQMDSQGILATSWGPGPFYINDNYVAAATENILFAPSGATGNAANPYNPSDITITNNWLYKPPAWETCGAKGTIPDGQIKPDGSLCSGGVNNEWVAKNSMEFDIGQRASITGNLLENNWYTSAQLGYSLVLTNHSQNATNLWISDILFQNNTIKNSDRGIDTLYETTDIGFSWRGYLKRTWIDNNLILLSTSLALPHYGMLLDGGNYLYVAGTTPGMTDFIFQHNTMLKIDGTPVDQSVYFSMPNWQIPSPYSCSNLPTGFSATANAWILDNVMTRQPTGDCGFKGIAGLNIYMFAPSGANAGRFFGNVMFVPPGDVVQTWPGASNDATTTPLQYVNPPSNYQLLVPNWLNTSDGKISGINTGTQALTISTTSLPNAIKGTPYSAVLTATGGVPPYTWSRISGSLPTGIFLNSLGVFSGTPTIAGTFTFVVQVTDSVSSTATKTLSITVVALTIDQTGALPGGTVGQFYTTTMTASGGVLPYTWSITSGFLPTGLIINSATGVISGNPIAAGTFHFTVHVHDSGVPVSTANLATAITISSGLTYPTATSCTGSCRITGNGFIK